MKKPLPHVDANPAPSALRPLAKYFWWMKSAEALSDRRRLALRIMDIGTWDDILLMLEHFPTDELRAYILSAQPGEIRPRALPYWLYKLEIPEDQHFKLPTKRIISKDPQDEASCINLSWQSRHLRK